MLGLILIAFIIIAFLIYNSNPKLGAGIKAKYKQQLASSLNHNGNHFLNPVPTIMAPPKWNTMKAFFRKGEDRKPDHLIPAKKIDSTAFGIGKSSSEIKFSWFGHSSVLLQIEGRNLLIDPVFSKRASMFTLLGPKRFDYEFQISVEDLPHIDAVLISHDHYDHLDYRVMKYLKDKVGQFYVPLGVRAHLEKWGVPVNHIIDLDWWEEVKFNEALKLVLTPARHFSGRGLTNRFSTLWGGWAILGKHKKVYFSGDSGYFNGFKDIGKKFGIFDLAFIECGQYHKDWESIHMLPAQSAQAAEDVNAKIIVPIHWGKFNLSLHGWTEALELFLKGAKGRPYKSLTPKPNEIMTLSDKIVVNDWWRK